MTDFLDKTVRLESMDLNKRPNLSTFALPAPTRPLDPPAKPDPKDRMDNPALPVNLDLEQHLERKDLLDHRDRMESQELLERPARLVKLEHLATFPERRDRLGLRDPLEPPDRMDSLDKPDRREPTERLDRREMRDNRVWTEKPETRAKMVKMDRREPEVDANIAHLLERLPDTKSYLLFDRELVFFVKFDVNL